MNTQVEQEGKRLTAEAIALYKSLKDYRIEKPAEYEKASEDLKEAKALLRTIDEKRKEMTRPLDEAKKHIIAFFRPATDKLNLAISRINQEMAAFRRRQAEEAKKKEAELKETGQDSDLFTPEVKPEIPKTVKIRKVWRFRIKDKSAIKPDFLIPDEKTIGELVRKLHEKAVDIVGGIEVYSEEVSYV